MKRSDMVKIIADKILNIHEWSERCDATDDASSLLEDLESLGMLPPRNVRITMSMVRWKIDLHEWEEEE